MQWPGGVEPNRALLVSGTDYATMASSTGVFTLNI